MAASQNGLTAKQQIVNWANTTTGGPISIVVDRTDLMFAPYRVRFTVDVSQAHFDTTETYDPVTDQSYSNGYSPAVHGLIYLWDIGDTGTWTLPEQTHANWQSKRFAKGPLVQHVYTQPGIYTVKLTVFEPSSGKALFAEASVTVADTDTQFPGTQTICVNPIGDTNFSAAQRSACGGVAAEYRHA